MRGTRVPGLVLAAVAGAVFAGPLAAQEPANVPLLAVTRGDSVFIYLLAAPPRDGFVVFRSSAGQPAVRRTAAAIRAVRDPSALSNLLGADQTAVLRAAHASDPGELLVRLRGDPFLAGVLSLMYRGVAVAMGRLYVDGGVTPGGSYGYELAFGSGDTARRVRASVTATAATPAPPSGGTARADDRTVELRWRYPRFPADPRDAVIGFHVYRADGAGAPHRLTEAPILRNDAVAPRFVDRDVVNGAAYRYTITAVDVLGRESAPSAPLAVTPRDRTPPDAPVDVVAVASEGAVRLAWRMAPEPDAAGYRVERAAGLGGPWAALTARLIPVGSPEYLDSGLAGGHQLLYRVIAVDSSGNASAASTQVNATPTDHTPPGAPRALAATLAQRRVTLQWQPPADRDVAGYYVYRADAAGRAARLTERAVAGPTFVDSGFGGSGLVPGARYAMRVSAVDSSGNEGAAASAWVSVPDDEPPSPPSAFGASAPLGRYVELRWSASGAPDVAAYELSRVDPGGAARVLARLSAESREARDTGAVAGTHYAYRLVAIDTAGNRSRPAEDSLTFGDRTPPAAPRAVYLRAVSGGTEISWERSASPDVAGYRVYRALLPTGTYVRVSADRIAELRWTDAPAVPGAWYTVRAVDRSGNESAASPAAAGPP